MADPCAQAILTGEPAYTLHTEYGLTFVLRRDCQVGDGCLVDYEAHLIFAPPDWAELPVQA